MEKWQLSMLQGLPFFWWVWHILWNILEKKERKNLNGRSFLTGFTG
jgi:hypothetical protein